MNPIIIISNVLLAWTFIMMIVYMITREFSRPYARLNMLIAIFFVWLVPAIVWYSFLIFKYPESVTQPSYIIYTLIILLPSLLVPYDLVSPKHRHF